MPLEIMDRKTHVVRYECEDCHAYFATEAEAIACEESHEEEEHAH
jgi:hypothetical protein